MSLPAQDDRSLKETTINQEPSLRHEHIIAQFCEIIGKTDVTEAESLLKACDWNLQNATAVYFEHYESLNSSPSWDNVPPADLTSSYQTDSQQQQQQQQQLPVSSIVETSTSSLLSTWLLDSMKNLGFTVLSLSQKIFSLFRLFCNSLSYATSAIPHTDFNTYFRDKFGEPAPAFYTHSFIEACQQASQQHKVLLLYIHQANSQYASCIPRHVFQNSTVLELIQENQVIVWASQVDDLEAKALIRRRLLPCAALPHLSFVVFPGVQSSELPVSSLVEQPSPFEFIWAVVGVQEGNVLTAERSISLLQLGIEKTSQFSQLNHRRELNIEETRRIREEQDKAYETARQKDLQRQAERELVEKQQKGEQERIRQQLQKAQDEQVLNQQILEAQRQKSAKQFFEWYKNEQKSGQQVMIRVRCCNSASFERSFDTCETTVSKLFEWIDTVAYLFESCVDDETKASRIVSVSGTLLTTEELKSWCGSVDGTIQSTDIPNPYSLVLPMLLDVQLKRTTEDETYFKTLQQLQLNSNTIFLLRPCVVENF